MKAILITAGVLSVVETPGKLEDLQKFVGGYIESGFTVASPDGKSRSITGYVDEEGLINGKVREFYGVDVDGFKNAFVGPVIIIGLNERTGATVGLSETEIAAVKLVGPRILQAPHLGLLRVPVIEIDTTKTKKKRKVKVSGAVSPTDDSGPQGDFLG
jgi:hypothetical protein